MTEIKMTARPWMPQDLLDDLQSIIDEESDDYLNTRRTTLEMALAYLKEHFAEQTWIPASEPPKEWKDENGDAINYLIYSPGIGVDIGNWIEPAKAWFCLGVPFKVTHWMPLPEPPKEEDK